MSEQVFQEWDELIFKNKVAQFFVGLGFSTGHADTIDDLLGEVEPQIKELFARIAHARNIRDQIMQSERFGEYCAKPVTVNGINVGTVGNMLVDFTPHSIDSEAKP